MGGGSLSSTLIKRKGFTLIELLAVIVVLAIIALITVPLIINVVDKSKKNAFEDSAYGIIEAGKLYYMEHIGEKETLDRYDFEIENKKFVLKEDKAKELKFTGTMPKTGMLQLHSNGDIAVSICNSSYCACKSASELKVTIKDTNCKINSETGEVEDTESISEVKLKELEEKVLALEKAKGTLEKNMNDTIKNLEKEKVKPGAIISYMRKTVPEGYLVCDGKVYNISDYKDLADSIKAEFGSYNHFGGNGTTTFAVPDLRGEFLRGTGTASRNTGSGSNVGVHQDATYHTGDFSYEISGTKGMFTLIGPGVVSSTASNYVNVDIINRNQDKSYGKSIGALAVPVTTHPTNFVTVENDYLGDLTNKPTTYTSRPTNTSVLYAIKY